jgi:hypothetical protein
MPPSSPDGDASPKRPFGQERRLGRNSSPMSESRVNRPEHSVRAEKSVNAMRLGRMY